MKQILGSGQTAWASVVLTTGVRYPSDGYGGVTATESSSIVADAKAVLVTAVTLANASAGTLGWILQCDVNGGGWQTLIQTFVPAGGLAEWNFGREGLLCPGPIRFQQAANDFITTFAFRRIE